MASFDLRSIKRQKFAVSSLLLTVGLAAAMQWPAAGLSVIPLLLITYLGVLWVLDFDLKKEEWVVLPIYALVLSAAAYYLLWWYIQQPWLRWSGVGAYGLAMYGLLLALNILNVATVRQLPLVRQALSVMSFAGTVGLFGAFYLLLATQPTIYEWVAAATVITFVMTWPLVWSSRLGQSFTYTKHDIAWTLGISLLAGEIATIVGLWPVSFMSSLIMAGSLSMIIGLVHYQQNRQVTKAVQSQYLLIGAVLLTAYYIVSQW